ncbi:DUF1176 domain-containing protein [Stappia stellulata]|uniref:DUF1176 domain-containing protein n=1 Tax=Stappia stellulata TaxID=71235 RepID=UPI0003FE9267|nr:DUF1176 domain-containing protein [Stappia stellulata]
MFPPRDNRFSSPPIPRRLPGGTRALAVAGWLVAGLILPASAETFGDWRLDCPTRTGCTLSTVAVDGADRQGEATGARLAFGAGEGTALSLAFEAARPRPDDRRAMQWSVDGRLTHVVRPDDLALFGGIDRFYLISPQASGTLFPALRAGAELRISYLDAIGEAHDLRFSLAGVTDGLRALAQALELAGVPEQIARPRDLAETTPPTRQQAVAALGIPYAVLDRHARTGACESTASPSIADQEVIIAAVSQVATLYAIACTAGGSHVTYRLYLRDSGEIGGVEALVFALHDPRFGWSGTDLLVNPDFDPETGTLSASYVGRSDRHCGYKAKWVWQDYAFRLTRFEGPETCADATRPGRWSALYATP